ncbi:MAG: hypothetical protein Q8K92_22820 [Leadbetterella sp.]|nr:hypothetical protein [Leadbetterella sp.]
MKKSNKKGVILCCFMYFITVAAFTQSLSDVKMYNELTQKAEINITNFKFDSALVNYNLAFEMETYHHTVDLYNACISTVYIKNFSDTQFFVEQLLLRGFPLNFFLQKVVFSEFRRSPNWLNMLSKYPSIDNECRKSLHWGLRARIEAMYIRDQFFAGSASGEERSDILAKVNKDNRDSVLSIINIHGYPNDKTMGVFFDSDTIYNTSSNRLHMLLFHMYQTGYYIDKTLKQLVFSGEVKPEEFIRLHDIELGSMSWKSTYGSEPFCKNGNKIYKRKFSEDMVASINLLRKEVMGVDYETFCLKLEKERFLELSEFKLAPYHWIIKFNPPMGDKFMNSYYTETNFTLK